MELIIVSVSAPVNPASRVEATAPGAEAALPVSRAVEQRYSGTVLQLSSGAVEPLEQPSRGKRKQKATQSNTKRLATRANAGRAGIGPSETSN